MSHSTHLDVGLTDVYAYSSALQLKAPLAITA